MLYEDEIDYKEEMRADMLREEREEYHREVRIREDFDYFVSEIGIKEFALEVVRIRKLCNAYGYEFTDVLDLV